MNNNWIIKKDNFETADVELNGSKFLIGNGYMGYRGTMEEYSEKELVAVNMAGLFDKNGDKWRESVNLPNPLYTVLSHNGEKIKLNESKIENHLQQLDIYNGIHFRKTTFNIGGTMVSIEAERFLSMHRDNIMAMKYVISADKDITLDLYTGIDTKIWDINGPHLKGVKVNVDGNSMKVNAVTYQNEIPTEVYEYVFSNDLKFSDDNEMHTSKITFKKEQKVQFTKICGIYWGQATENSLENISEASQIGYEKLKQEHIKDWENIWAISDVIIEGDEETQLALRYSIYHLNSIAPKNTDKCGIPARGLSGQVYKGASFWDTEMFMLPYFSFTNPKIAENLVKYRINTIEGAKRKAKEFGHEGAFFAWESQETGDDACTLFNVTDIFTNRPQRTYFKDKQIHVSADIVHALWNYCTINQNYEILKDGGLELIYQCVWFYYTYSSFKTYKNRYEFMDVVGPDEYHERVDNNAFTNCMILHSAKTLVKAINKVKTLYPDTYNLFVDGKNLDWINEFSNKIYMPQPDKNGIIEQFDKYLTLEDVSVDDLRKRELKENEYWGGHGLASTTRVLKQADVVMMLSVFQNQFSSIIKKANWDFYEPYTEHGSSLSACAYSIVAANIGDADWAYKYFMKTACVDLTGNTRQYLGSLYIGGTHPAANGGAWNTAIFGFAGVSYTDNSLDITPNLPKSFKSLNFKLKWHGKILDITIRNGEVKIKSDSDISNLNITVNGGKIK